jgi:hypothetical protein
MDLVKQLNSQMGRDILKFIEWVGNKQEEIPGAGKTLRQTLFLSKHPNLNYLLSVNFLGL